MDKLTFREWSIIADLEIIAPLGEDFEFSMARGELKTAQDAVKRLMGKLKGEGDLEAWVQSKITKAAEYLDTVADHLSYGEDDTVRKSEVKEDIEILDANGNLFVTVIDIIKGSDDKFKGFTAPVNEKCWDGYKQLGVKKKGQKVVPNCVKEDTIDEANKSGDSSLRDWFTKSRSSDGTPGWVQLGGKYAGKPCAKQPGQTTKPKCGSSKMKDDLSNKEEESAFRRKNQEDPNPDRTGKAKMVATEEKDACYSKVKSRYSVWPSAYASGALVKCRKVGAANWGNKSESIDLISKDPLSEEMGVRYCPKCEKDETSKECKYGEKYWAMFSIPSSLAPEQPYSIAKVHPANEQTSFEIGGGHKSAQKQAKIRNLATGTTNPNEKSAALRKLSGPSLPLADSVIQPGQLTNEDYQRIQSTGNVYTILFSWRGRPMMNLQLFFPNMKRPSKDEVKSQIEKLYPGAVVMQWYPSPTDPSKPIVVIQDK